MPTSLTQLRDAGRLAVAPFADEDLMYIAQPAQSPKSRAVKWSAILAELRGAGVATISVDTTTADVTLDISTNKTEELVVLLNGSHRLTLSGAPLKNTSITVISSPMSVGNAPSLALSAAYHGPAYMDAKAAPILFHSAGGFVRYYARPDGTWQGALGIDFGAGSDQIQALGSSLAGVFSAMTAADGALAGRCTALEGRATELETFVETALEFNTTLNINTPVDIMTLALTEGTWEVSAGVTGTGPAGASAGEVMAEFVGSAGVTQFTTARTYMTVPGLYGHGSCALSARSVVVVGTSQTVKVRATSNLTGVDVYGNIMARRIK